MTTLDQPSGPCALTESERQICHVTAALMAADKRLDWIAAPLILSLVLTTAAMAAGTISIVPGLHMGLAAALLLGGIERYLALRISFDQGLFTLLASEGGLTLSGLDKALGEAHLVDASKLARPLPGRIKGAVRLVRLHVLVVTVQIAIMCGIIFLAST